MLNKILGYRKFPYIASNKKKIDKLPFTTKKIVKEIYTLIRQDYQQLDNLIKKIEESIKTTKKYKNKSTLGLIGSGILGITGIVGGLYVCNGNSLWYGVSTVSNALSAFGHYSTMKDSDKLIEELKNIVEAAYEQKKKIVEEQKYISELLKSLEGCCPK